MNGYPGAVLPTTVLRPPALSDAYGCYVTVVTEAHQRTGSFKFRATWNLVTHIEEPLIVAASSGNFGQALACACRLAGKRCIVVMPATSAAVKIAAVRSYGGVVELTDVSVRSRAEALAAVAAANPGAYIASAFDDDYVIDGNATLGDEIAAVAADAEAVVVPVGGGGLASGVLLGLRRSGHGAAVYGAEPALANDAARSIAAGRIVSNDSEPATIADGARTPSLGERNFRILADGIAGIVEVSENAIAHGVRDLFSLANVKAEPTGALAAGALREHGAAWRGRHVVIVVSGGNVDPDNYARIIRDTA